MVEVWASAEEMPSRGAQLHPHDLTVRHQEVEAVLDADEDEFEVEGKQHGGARLPSADARQEDKNTKSTGGKKSKKKSRKKGKKGSSGGAEEEGQSAWVQEDDNIDAILQELNLRSSQKVCMGLCPVGALAHGWGRGRE